MANIRLKSLRCVEQEDRMPDGDEIRLDVLTRDHRTVTVWKGKMRKGDKKDLDDARELESVSRLTLVDEDCPDPDDILGHWNAPFLSTDGRDKIHSFTGEGAHYELVYAID